jgi:hypothetical protein
MTSENHYEERAFRTLEEICENTRAIRRVANRILDHMHEHSASKDDEKDPYDMDGLSWIDLEDNDDMYS